MCAIRERVVVVDDDRLSVPWAAAVPTVGRPVVFVRRSSMGLLPEFCRSGAEACPILQAVMQARLPRAVA